MHQSNHSKIYTADELIRYHNGLMTEQEMHKLEKAALEDQFLSDALDGYKIENNSKENLLKIETELNNYNNSVRKSFNIRKYYSSLSIAASILAIAIAAYFILQPEDSHQIILAKNEQKVIEKKELMPEATIQSSDNSTVTVDKNSDETLITNKNTAFKSSNKSYYPSIDIKTPIALASTLEDSFKLASNQTTVSASEFKDNAKIFEINQDSAMQNTIASADSKMSNAPAVQQKDLGYNNKAEITILDEVVVTTVASKKSKKQISWAATKEREKIASDSLQIIKPDAGRLSFLNYVNANKRNCVEKDGTAKKGKVILSFKLNKIGKPINIKVEKSLSESCNKEAIRLLNSGPKWEGKRNKKTTVEIEF